MAGGKGNIDAISVSLGADLGQLRKDLRAAKSELDKALPQTRNVHVSVSVTTPKHAVADLYKDIQGQFQEFQKNNGQALRIAPRMTVDPRVMRDFRRDLERNMMQAGRSGQAVRVPIKFNGDIKAFIASIGHVEVPVYGRWAGWSSGGGPPDVGGGGGGGGGAPRGPRGVPGRGPGGRSGPAGGGPAPTPARGRPAGARATGGTVVPPHTYAGSGGRRDDSSSDRYSIEEDPGAFVPRGSPVSGEFVSKPPGGAGRQPYATPGTTAPAGTRSGANPSGRATGTPSGARPPTPRQQRQAARRAAMSGAAPPTPTPTRTSYGPGSRNTVGSNVNPGYVEPTGGRVTVGNVRSGSATTELPRGSQARAEYESQQRARPTRGADLLPQPGEPGYRSRGIGGYTTTQDSRVRARNIQKGNEALARIQRERDAAERRASPADVAARGHIATNFASLDPDLGTLFQMINDPNYQGTYEEFLDAAEASKKAYATAFHGGKTVDESGRIRPTREAKRATSHRRVAGGHKKGAITDVPPDELLRIAALDAARQFAKSEMNPLEVVQKGDPSSAAGGKVGPMHGRNAGRLASETVQPGIVDEILQRKAEGVTWPQIESIYGKQAMNRAKGRIRARSAKPPEVAPIEAGKAYGGGAEMYAQGEAPPVQGGQGAGMRPDPKPRQYATREQMAESSALPPIRGRSRPRPRVGAPSLHEEVSGSTAVRATGSARGADLRTPGGASSARTPAPPKPDRAARAAGVADVAYEKWGMPGEGYSAHGPSPAGSAPGPMPSDARSHLPPPPERRAYGRNTDYRSTGHGGSAGFFEFLKNFKGGAAAGGPTFGPRHSDRIQKLMAMAGQTEQSPHEAEIARGILRRRGIPGFAEGGTKPGGFGRPRYGLALGLDLTQDIPAQYLRGVFGGTTPRKGSRERKELEEKLKAGVRNRLASEKKPPHQRGSGYNPEFDKNRQILFEQAQKKPGGPRCAICGRPVEIGGKGFLAARADHKDDSASGGGDELSNLQILCNSCNSYKGGGKSKRDPYTRPFAPGLRGLRSYLTDIGDQYAEGGLAPGLQDLSYKFGRRAEGGGVKWTGLASSRGGIKSATMVGERGPEIMVEGHNGKAEVIPSHKIAGFMDGMADGGLQYRQAGGAAYPYGRGIRATGSGATGATLGARMAGAAGAAVGAGTASSTMGSILRVFVTNWPTGFGAGGAGAAFGNPAQANAAAPGVGQAIPGTPPAGPFTPPGTPPTPGQGGGGTAPRVDPLGRVRARRAGRQSVDALTEQLLGARGNISNALQESPVRALSVTFGQIAQQLVGGRAGIQFRARQAGAAAGVAGQEIASLSSLQEERRAQLERYRAVRRDTRLTPDERRTQTEGLIGERRGLRPAIAEQTGIAERATTRAETASKGILTPTQLVKTQAVGLAGIIGGTALFSAAISAFSTATAAAVTVLDPLIQSMLGWPAAIDKVTASIRDSIQAAGGNVRAGVAAAVAPSGVSARFLDASGANLTRTGTYRAAATAGASAEEITRASTGRPRGLFTGTGGLLGTNIGTELFGGQPGFMETVAGRLGAGGNGRIRSVVDPTTGRIDREALEQSRKRTTLSQIFGGGIDKGLQEKTVTDLNKNLQSAAEYAGDLTGGFKLLTDATDDQKEAMVDSATNEEERRAAQKLADTGVAVVGQNGANLRGGQFAQYAEAQARGQLIQDPELLLRAREPQRRAQAFGIAAQHTFQRGEDIPAQAALQNLIAPLGKIGAGYSTLNASAETLKRVADEQADSTSAQEKIAEVNSRGMAAMENIVSRVDNASYYGGLGTSGEGPQKGATGGRVGPALTRFRELTGQIGGLGTQIQAKVDTVQQAQATLQAHEYADQLRVANRSLTDAQDLWAGINGANKDTLGGLQGQNILLDRQNQLLGRRQQRLSFKSEAIGFKASDLQIQAQNLGFQQSQRQINFNKAVAGFAAPGSTPEERAARINEAKLEAEFAQKQLNLQIQIAEQGRQQLKIAKEQAGINRAQFGNQVQQQDNQFKIAREEAKRAITDIQAGLLLLEEGHEVMIDTAAAEEAIANLQKAQGVLVDEAQDYLTQGQEVRTQVLEDTKDLMAATGKGFSQLVGNVQTAWDRAFKASYENYLVPLTKYLNQLGSGTYTGGGTGGGDHDSAGRIGGRADGIIGSTAGPTQFLAGEAGREHVVVLRNATEGTLMGLGGGGGGGGVNVGGVTIVVSGTKDMDEAKLAEIVVERMARKLAMLGV